MYDLVEHSLLMALSVLEASEQEVSSCPVECVACANAFDTL